jgi:hypothetical protein
MRLRKLLIVLILPLVVLEGCNNSNNDQVDQLACTGYPALSAMPAVSIREIDAFLDASGSMKGFMTPNQGTDFQSLVADLFGRISRDIQVTKCFALSQKTRPIEILNMDQARKAIAYGKFDYGNSSTLPAMFDTCIHYLSDNSVSLLITDGIYTPPAAAARMKYQETTDIAGSLSNAAKKNMIVDCLAFRSTFGDSTSLYYIFILGSPQNVMAIKDKIHITLTTISALIANKGFEELGFGFPAQTPFYSIIPYVENTGAGEPTPCPNLDNRYLAMSNLDVEANARFWVGVDLSSCPSYINLHNYLNTEFITFRPAFDKYHRVDRACICLYIQNLRSDR